MVPRLGLADPRRLLTAIGTTIAIIVWIAPPTGYALISHEREVDEVDAQAKAIATQLSRFVYGKGETWKFQELRLSGLIDPAQTDGDVARVRLLEPDGTPFLETGEAQRAPLIAARAPVLDGDRTVATVEVSESWRGGVVNTVLIALVTALLAGLILLMTRIGSAALRNRALDEAAQREQLAREVEDRTREIARRNEQLLVEIRQREETEARLRAARDETEKARRELATAIESINEAFALYDRDDRLIIFNTKFVDLHHRHRDLIRPGVARAEIIRAVFSELYPNEHEAERLAATVRDGIAAEVGTIDVQFDAKRWYRRSGRSTADGGLVVLLTDITSLKEHEEVLRKAKDEAETLSRAKSQFLANMSHEIRTPMNGVIGMAELLERTELGDRQRRLVGTIRQSATSLLAVINDILDFSRIEAGRFELDCIAFDLREAIEDTVEMMAEAAEAKGLEIACRIAPAVPACVMGDPSRLRQVLINLLGNAVKFTLKGEVVLEVDAAPAGDAPVVTFAVRDTGIGIATDVKARLFKPFEQADNSISRRFGGTGLGLSITRHLVGLMGGTITVESEVGKGSTFRFAIPLAPAADGPAGADRRLVDLTDLRVLVVDDNETNREIVLGHLRSWRIDAVAAVDGPGALAQLRNAGTQGRPFGLAVLDMMMPGMNGIDLARAIKADSRIADTRLVMLTSVNWSGELGDTAEAGIGALLTKPMRQSALFDAIRSLMAAARRTGAAAPVAPHDATKPARATVLVAEDNPVNQEVAIEFLSGLGCAVDVVGSGLDAVAAVAARRYDLVLMDCQMPEMDGLEATRQIRARERTAAAGPTGVGAVPIVAVTAHAFEEDRQHCLDAGMNDYLSKPFTMDQLDALLRRWIVAGSTPAAPRDTPQPVAPPDGPAIDPAPIEALRGLERANGSNFVRRILGLYLETAPVEIERIAKAIASGDAPGVQIRAHSLKSGSANVGAMRLSKLFAALEAIGRSGELGEATATLDRIAAEFVQVRTALSAELEAENALPPQRRAG